MNGDRTAFGNSLRQTRTSLRDYGANGVDVRLAIETCSEFIMPVSESPDDEGCEMSE